MIFLKILHITPIHVESGGYSRGHIDLAKELLGRGIESVFVIPEGNGVRESMEELGFRYYGISKYSIGGLNTISFELGIKRRLPDILREECPDIVLTETVGSIQTISAVNKSTSEIRTILWEKSPPTESSFLGWLQWYHWKRSWKKVGSSFSATMFQSLQHREFVERRIGISSPSPIIMENGVDVSEFERDAEISRVGKKVVYCGTISEARGIPDLIKAGEILEEKEIQFQINLFGRGPYLDTAMKISAEKEWLIVHGFLDSEEYLRELSEASIGVVPHPNLTSWRICSPLKLREYASLSMAVVAGDLPTHKTFENEPWMFIGMEEGANGIAMALEEALLAPDLEKIGKMARDYATKNFTYSSEMEDLFSWIG